MTSKQHVYEIVFHPQAEKEFLKLPKKRLETALEIIEQLKNEPRPQGVSKLSGYGSAYRIRLGQYRIIYEVHAKEIVIYVIGVAHRKDIYRKILKRLH